MIVRKRFKRKVKDGERCGKVHPSTGDPCLLSKDHEGLHVSVNGTYACSREVGDTSAYPS